MLSCSQCKYTTKRKYNLERHIALVHECNNCNDSRIVENGSRFVDNDSRFVDRSSRFVDSIHELSSSTINPLKCNECNKIFKYPYLLNRHLQSCSQKKKEVQCSICKVWLSSKASLSNHKHRCKGFQMSCIVDNRDDKIVQNNTITNSHVNSHNTNITTNNINLLVFPKDGQDFDFIIDHIKDQVMKQMISHRKPEIGFRQFIGKVLENPSNRIVSKSNVKDRFNKIHVGNGKWEMDTDNAVIPVVAHHMTTAALQKMEDMKRRKAIDDIRMKAKEFIRYIDLINTDDECTEYKDALDNIKVILVNLFHLDE